MKLLIYQNHSCFLNDIYEACTEKNIAYDVFEWNLNNCNRDELFQDRFVKAVDGSKYDAVLSINFYPAISTACMKKNIKYIAWCYENPLSGMNIETSLNNSVNYVFLFDKMQFWKYIQKGFETVYYLPLGVNKTRLLNISLAKSDWQEYTADVSFVGDLCESEWSRLYASVNEYTKGYLKSLLHLQSQIYGDYLFDDLISDEMVENIVCRYNVCYPGTDFPVTKESLTHAMASEVTRNERILLLNLCGRRYNTKLYSNDKSELLKNVTICGEADYITQRPLIYASSRINLHPTFRSILTGIPIDALHIMGAGGFLLANYQEELTEYFVNEEDMVIYESIEDAYQKIHFYLAHEDIRCKVAENGRRKTLEEYSLQQRMDKIAEVVGL